MCSESASATDNAKKPKMSGDSTPKKKKRKPEDDAAGESVSAPVANTCTPKKKKALLCDDDEWVEKTGKTDRRRTHGWSDDGTPPVAAGTRSRTAKALTQDRTVKVQTRAATAKPFENMDDITNAMCGKRSGGMLAYTMSSFDLDGYYRAFKGPGDNKILRRFQATKLSVLSKMKRDMRFRTCLEALSEYEFGFQELQANCRKIVVPVGDGLGLGSRGLWGPPDTILQQIGSRVEGSLGPT